MNLLLSVVIALLVLGFVLWLVKKLPLDDTIKQIISGVAIFAAVLVVLDAALTFFGYPGLRHFAPGRHPSR